MFEKLKALFAVFRVGAQVADPKAWKNGSITATVLAGFLMALVYLGAAFGITIPITPDAAAAIAGGVIAVVNVVVTLISSKHVGIPGLQPAGESSPADVSSPAEVAGGPAEAPRSPPVSRFDDATRQRAEEFLRARKPGNPSDVGFEAP